MKVFDVVDDTCFTETKVFMVVFVPRAHAHTDKPDPKGNVAGFSTSKIKAILALISDEAHKQWLLDQLQTLEVGQNVNCEGQIIYRQKNREG